MLRKITEILAIGLAVLALTLPAAARAWPTTEFVIVQSDPYSDQDDDEQQHRALTDDEFTALTDMEVFFQEVAERYQAMGFRAPELRLVDGYGSGKAYKVNFFDYDDRGAPFRVRRVTSSITEIQIDSSRPFQKDGVPFDRTYEHIAHELFHIVQRAYQPSANVIQNDWIIEGQAQAMGMYMLKKILRKDPYFGSEDGYRLGARPYYVPLQDHAATRLGDGAYRTSSFWRYVGEVYAASKKNGRAGVEEIEPDYGYLLDMYKNPYASSASYDADLLWTDKGMRDALGYGLDRVYANFVSTFADYAPARLTKATENGPDAARENWQGFVFDGCGQTANLTATSVSANIDLSISGNSARCFTTLVWGEGKADVSLQIRSSDADALAALRIGTAGGTKVGSPVLIAPIPGGGYIGHWRFNVDAGERQVFVVSNMAADPTKSEQMLFRLNVSSGFWESNMTQPRQTAASNKPPPRAAPTPLARDATREQAVKEFSEGLDTLNNRSANSANVSHNYETRGCVRQTFAEHACGPTTSIYLTLMPGPFADGFQTTGTGGGLAQVMQQFMAMGENGPFATDQGLKDAFGEAAAMEGSYVQLLFPAIDYGFTGTFNDAKIEVNGGEGHGEYEARGPRDIQTGRGRLFPYSGKVTIEEFTPFMLRGSFSGQLTDLSTVDFDTFGDDQSLPVQREISGRFAISAPWEGDRRAEVYPVAGNTIGSAMEDLYEVFPAARNFDIEDMIELDKDAVGGSGNAFTIGMFPISEITGIPICKCECQFDKDQPRACLKVCKPKVLSCGQANEIASRLGTALQEQNALAEDVDRMRSDFEDYLKTQWNGDMDMVNMYLGIFDDQKTPADKRRIVAVQGMDISTYGDDEVQRNAANPPKPTRAEYLANLKADGLSQPQIDRLMRLMDEAMAEIGGWPTD